jgi:hypothetical protein
VDRLGRQVVRFPTFGEERGVHFREIPEHKLKEGG